MSAITLKRYSLKSIDEFIDKIKEFKTMFDKEFCFEIVEMDKQNKKISRFFKNGGQYICNCSIFHEEDWLKTTIYGANTWSDFKKFLKALKNNKQEKYLILIETKESEEAFNIRKYTEGE